MITDEMLADVRAVSERNHNEDLIQRLVNEDRELLLKVLTNPYSYSETVMHAAMHTAVTVIRRLLPP